MSDMAVRNFMRVAAEGEFGWGLGKMVLSSVILAMLRATVCVRACASVASEASGVESEQRGGWGVLVLDFGYIYRRRRSCSPSPH